jgi:hypothetical protein
MAAFVSTMVDAGMADTVAEIVRAIVDVEGRPDAAAAITAALVDAGAIAIV